MSVGAVKQGTVDFLTKPVDNEVLLQTTDRALARHEGIVRERTEIEARRAPGYAHVPRV
jgi:FixJ family two-component response regulator